MQKNDLLLSRSNFLTSLLAVGISAALVVAAAPALHAQDQDQNYQGNQAPPPGSARLAHLEGTVSYQPNGAQDWGQAGENMPLGAGDRVYTDQGGRGELQAETVRAYFGPNSDVTLTNMNQQGVELGIASGSVAVYSDGLREGQSLFVSTPNGGVTLPGQGAFRIDVYPDDQSTVISVRPEKADVQLNGAGDFQMVLRRGESVQLSGTNPVYTQPLQLADYDAFDHWSGAIESHRYNSVSLRYVSPQLPGYDELDRAGDWQPESDYGPVWYPHVNADWAPYRNGHWVNRPFFGPTWVEDESWGAAPFHYGRWVRVNDRWGWIPGPRDVRPIWSPAQVVFAAGVQVGGVGVSVWFPLGPGEAYHPWYNAGPQYVNQINQTNIRESKVVHIQNTYVTNTVNNTTIINNTTYVNRTVGATAVPQQVLTSGKPVQAAAVKVTPAQMQQVHIAPPPVRPVTQAAVLRPVAKPAAAPAARPVLIDHKGQQAAATPNARPVVVPVKATPPPAPKPIAGHTAVGTPTIAGKPVAAPARPNQPAPGTPAPNQPGGNRPGNAPAPVTAVPGRPNPAPAPAPVTPNRPNVAPTPAPVAPNRPNTTPAPPQVVPNRPNTAPAPSPNPAVPGRPAPAPAPNPARPAPAPVEPVRPNQPAPPANRPVPPVTEPARPQTPPQTPQNRPVPPESRPMPPANRPVPPAAEPARPVPPATRPLPPENRPPAPVTRPATPEARPVPPNAQKPAPPAKPAPKKDEKKTPPPPPEPNQ